jgi:hypothetical protein
MLPDTAACKSSTSYVYDFEGKNLRWFDEMPIEPEYDLFPIPPTLQDLRFSSSLLGSPCSGVCRER